MKKVNETLSILILLLAIVSAVFSYFLYEKRTQFIDGWNQLTSSIHQNSANLDKNSGTGYAKGLSKDKLAHTKYATLPATLKTFYAQCKAVIDQRDSMAETLFEIGKQVGVSDASQESYGEIETYKKQTDALKDKVSETIKNRNDVYRKVAEIGGIIGVSINVGNLKQKNGSTELNTFKKMVEKKRDTQAAYKTALEKIGGTVNSSAALPEDDGAAADEISRGVQKRLDSDEKKLRDLETANRGLRNDLDEALASKKRAEEGQKKAEDDQKKAKGEIKKLLNIIGIASMENVPETWKEGSKEARSYLRGKVIEVSHDYGYVVIDLGTQSTVIQKIGKMQCTINLKLVPGVRLQVVRGEKTPELIATVTLDKIGEKISVANIPPNAKTIKVGDFVIAE